MVSRNASIGRLEGRAYYKRFFFPLSFLLALPSIEIERRERWKKEKTGLGMRRAGRVKRRFSNRIDRHLLTETI